MTPTLTFFAGLLLLALFIWYFLTDLPARKRNIGLVLTILLVAFCIEAITPPSKKIRLGLDLQGGTSFLLRLIDETGEGLRPGALDQAIEVIRKRVDQFGVSEPIITSQGSDRIMVQIPGLDTKQLGETKDQLQRVAKLEFALVHPQTESILAQVDNLLGRQYATAAQRGATGFDASGRFVARPFAGPVIGGERPLLHSTFLAPGAPRTTWVGLRLSFP